LGCAGSRYPVNKRKRSLRDIAAEPEARGHFNERLHVAVYFYFACAGFDRPQMLGNDLTWRRS
jgi:hypothetical protein